MNGDDPLKNGSPPNGTLLPPLATGDLPRRLASGAMMSARSNVSSMSRKPSQAASSHARSRTGSRADSREKKPQPPTLSQMIEEPEENDDDASSSGSSTTSETSPSASSPSAVTNTASLHSGLSNVVSNVAAMMSYLWKQITHLSHRPKNREYLDHSSLFILGQDNTFRNIVCNIVHSKVFESFIILVIGMNCVVLAMDDPTTNVEPPYQQALNQFFLVVFATEMFLKMIAFGVFLHVGSYFRNGWNAVDFFIVVLSFMQLIPSFGNFTAFRTLRVIRPLRSMNAIPQLKTIASCLVHSVKGLANVFLLAIFTFLILSILAVQLWMGNFVNRCAISYDDTIMPDMFCSTANGGSVVGASCPTGYHCVYYGNPNNGYTSFDNVGWGLMIVFQTITLEGWSTLMYSAMDACGWPLAIFFVLTVIVGCYFVLNLCLAVICFQFQNVKQRTIEKEIEQAKQEEMEIRKSEEGIQRARESLRLMPGTLEQMLGQPLENDAMTHMSFGNVDVHRVVDPKELLVMTPTDRCHLVRQLSQTGAGSLLLVSLRETLFAVPDHNQIDPSHYAYETIKKLEPKLPPWKITLSEIRLKVFQAFDNDPIVAHIDAQKHIETAKLRTLGRPEEADRLKHSMPDLPSSWFAKVMFACIVGNTVVLAAQRFQQSDMQTLVSNNFNIAFTAIFGLELAIKLFYLSPYWYCRDFMNIFDGAITIVSLVEVIFLSGSSTFSVFRAFRMLRLMRLVQGIPSLRQLVEVFELAVHECGYLFVIFGLYFLIAALVGMQFFADSLQTNGLPGDPVRSSFGSFIEAFCTILQINTYDSWPDIMWNSMYATTPAALIFYVSCILIGNLCITNLLVAIMINSFEEYAKKHAGHMHLGGEDPDSSDEDDEAVIQRGIAVTVLAAEQAQNTTTIMPRGANDFLAKEIESAAELVVLHRNATTVQNHNGESETLTSSQEDEEMVSLLHDGDASSSDGGDVKICDVCGQPLQKPFPPISKSIEPITAEVLHDRICERIQFRKIKERVIKSLLNSMISLEDNAEEEVLAFEMVASMGTIAPQEASDHGANAQNPFATHVESGEFESPFANMVTNKNANRKNSKRDGRFPTPANIEDVFGKAWEVGLMLGENVEDYVNCKSWDPIKKLLNAEQELLHLCIGEEQIGGALCAYTRANVPHQFLTNGGDALFVFGPRNWLRVQITGFIQWPPFDYFVLAVIVASSIALALDNPSNSDTVTANLSVAGKVFTTIFCVELLFKSIAYGFAFHEGAYLRDPWNWLDFLVVGVSVASWITEAYTNSRTGFLMVLRTLRVLRPLRLVNKYRGLRLVVLTLLQSIKGITNMTLILVMVFLIFAILGVQLFGGILWQCNDTSIGLRVECNGTYWNNFSAPGLLNVNTTAANGSIVETTVIAMVNYTIPTQRAWINAEFHFDDTYNALISLLHIATLDNWGNTMYSVVDGVDYDHGPVTWAKPQNAAYFVVFVLVGAIFMLNMYIGLIIENFQSTKDHMDGIGVLTDAQRLWVETQRMMLNYRPQPLKIPGKFKVQKVLAHICEETLFELTSAAVVLMNIVVIGIEHQGQSDGLSNALDDLNVLFTALFLLEAIMKISAYGHRYFLDGWNRFDFFIVALGMVDISTSGNVLPINVGLIRILRVFRIARILALVRKARDIRVLIETLWYSMPSLANIGGFMVLVLFMFTVLGVQIFGQVPQDGIGLTNHMNFENFGNAFLFLIQLTTLDNWGQTMISLENTVGCDASVSLDGVDHCGSQLAPLYFFPFILISGYVMVNLFCAIILDNFDTTMELDMSRLKVADLKKFADAWALFDPDATMLTKTQNFPNLLAALKPPLGIERKTDRHKLLKITREYVIPEHEGEIHFVETLIPLARAVLGVVFEDEEIREHEELWKLQFPDLAKLRVVRYRQKRVTVDQYFAATYIAGAFRRRLARKVVNCMRRDKRDDIITWYEDHDVSEEGWTAIQRMDREEQERRRNMAANRRMILDVVTKGRKNSAGETEVSAGDWDEFGENVNETAADPATLIGQLAQDVPIIQFTSAPRRQSQRKQSLVRRESMLKPHKRRQSLGLSGFTQLWAKHAADL